MQVNTGTFQAVTAETAMLRQRARRGRHRAPRKPGTPQRYPPRRAWFDDGYHQAMADLSVIAGQVRSRAPVVTAGEVLDALMTAVQGTMEATWAREWLTAWEDGDH
jgi:hypothetical protein